MGKVAKGKRKNQPGKRAKTKANETESELAESLRSALISEMKSIGYDGDFFVRNLQDSVERSKKRGKGPHRTRYLQYCTWAHALLKKEIGQEDAEHALPEVVFNFIRKIVPGDVKGEIREDAFKVTLQEFCRAINLPPTNGTE